MNDNPESIRLLSEIRDNQKLQIERQAEALAMQKEQLEMVKKQMDRAEKIQDRAEQLQERGSQMMSIARKALYFLLPIIILLVLYLTWLIFR